MFGSLFSERLEGRRITLGIRFIDGLYYARATILIKIIFFLNSYRSVDNSAFPFKAAEVDKYRHMRS